MNYLNYFFMGIVLFTLTISPAFADFNLIVLNEQSYPTLGGTWTVQFETSGMGDLIITSVDDTTLGNSLPDDLRFINLHDGNMELTPEISENTITYKNYFSNEIATLSVQVLTPGKHHLEFSFENSESKIVKYAHNNVVFQTSGDIKKTSSDNFTGDFFGFSIDVSDNMLVIGASLDDDNGINSGSAYIFERNQGGADNWGQVKKITASDGATNDDFGTSVAIFDDTVVVGSPKDDDSGNDSGSAYIFERNQGGADNWGQVKKITASDAVAADFFGESVAINDDFVVVGAWGKNDGAFSDSGSAYIFERNQGGADNWGQVKKLVAPNIQSFGNFGRSVGIYADNVVVGANGIDTGAGSAYVFFRNQGGSDNWGLGETLTASDAVAFESFGWSVSISKDIIVIGARNDNDNGNGSGSAYVFERFRGVDGKWGQIKKLIAFDGTDDDRFGWSVAVHGDTIVVGSDQDDDSATNSGSAYVFERNQGGADNWGQVKKIIASDGATSDHFGRSVTIANDIVIVGSPFNDSSGELSGAFYIFPEIPHDANNWIQTTKRISSDGVADDFFGDSISISGDIIVVGSPRDDDNGNDSGSAYIFSRNQGGADNWGQVKKITASDAASGDFFGSAVAIHGDRVVVGAGGDNNVSGSAYIFERNQGGVDNWGEITKLSASDATNGDQFGTSVAIHGDDVVIGANWDDDNGNNSGSVYVFKRNNGNNMWEETLKIFASDGSADDLFGTSVATNGDVVVVGALLDDDNGIDSGSAYIFERNQGGADNWGQVKKITADATTGDRFGSSVAINHDAIVVGSPRNDESGSNSGSAYIFERNQGGADNWGQVKKITASDANIQEQFGTSVAINGDVVVVGANLDNDNGSASGSAYVFERNQGGADNWGQVKKLLPSDGDVLDHFGESVALSGDTIVISSSWDDENGGDFAGSFYVFIENGRFNFWSEIDKKLALDGTVDDFFGTAVAISGDIAVIGASLDDDNGINSGSAYIFERNQGGADNWGQVKKITASDGTSSDQFGSSVALYGDTVVIGANWDSDNGSVSGSAYIFERNQGGGNNWGQVAKLIASDATSGNFFGESVAIYDNTVVIGAWSHDNPFNSSGAAYIFERNQGGADNWGQVAKLVATQKRANAHFGWSVAIHDDVIVIGVRGDDGAFSDSGSAYIFSRNQGGADNWGEVKKIVPSESDIIDSFGEFISISGDAVVIGSVRDDDNGLNSGSAYIFSENNCLPPGSGTWVISSSCILINSIYAPGSVIVQNGATLTVQTGTALDIDFTQFHLTVESGSGVLIKSGSSIE